MAARYEDYIDILRQICQCEKGRGTNHTDFDKALRFLATAIFRVRRVHRPRLGDIEQHLREDGAVIISYLWNQGGEWSRHFSLLVGASPSGSTLYIVNDLSGAGPAYQPVRRTRFIKENLRYQRSDPHWKGWFLTPE
jgi:hypothetical protein